MAKPMILEMPLMIDSKKTKGCYENVGFNIYR